MSLSRVHPADWMRVALSGIAGGMSLWAGDPVMYGVAAAHFGFAVAWLLANCFHLIDQERVRGWGYVPAFLDINAITLLAVFTGGGNSVVSLGYVAITAISSLHAGVRQGLFACVFSSLGFLAMVWGIYLGWLPAINILGAGTQTSLAYAIVASALIVPVLFTTHKVVDSLVHKNRELLSELWGEMELARRIQTALIPDEPRLEGYEIAAYISPAEQVGGDYYDIISAGGIHWIAIGDVSGHGVPAGLIMMMLQTAVRTAIAQKPEITPEELLTIANRVMYENIRRLDEKRYITITALALHVEGRFYFSGMHQDILIYRASSATVEAIETSGMWLGVLDEIGEDLEPRSLSLAPGDCMLLYTDGLPEARGIDGSMYSHERLARRFAELAMQQTPPEILRALTEELGQFERDDDVTLIAVRRDAD